MVNFRIVENETRIDLIETKRFDRISEYNEVVTFTLDGVEIDELHEYFDLNTIYEIDILVDLATLKSLNGITDSQFCNIDTLDNGIHIFLDGKSVSFGGLGVL